MRKRFDLEGLGHHLPGVPQALEKAIDFAEQEILELLARDPDVGLEPGEKAYFIHKLLGQWLMLLAAWEGLSYRAPALVQDTGVLTHVIGAPFLRECSTKVKFGARNDLGPPDSEKMVYVLGFVQGNLAFPMRIISFKSEARSAQAKAEPQSVARAMAEVDPFEYTLLGLYHSHPGRGPQGPSGLDRETQSSWEAVYKHCVGAIFTDEGHARFFRAHDDFRIQIIGDGVQPIDEHTFLLEG
jgi:proteasome lid subunit RPN8/RPN11